jgi:WD40 repeat protein
VSGLMTSVWYLARKVIFCCKHLYVADEFLFDTDRTVRSYSFPDLKPQFIFTAHRAAVNAVSISKDLIVSGSGDRSVRLWDARTGKLLRTFENHHSRGSVGATHSKSLGPLTRLFPFSELHLSTSTLLLFSPGPLTDTSASLT